MISIAPKTSTKQLREILRGTIPYGLICLGAAVLIIPIFWMVSSSLKSWSEVLAVPPTWLPHPPKWSNYLQGWTALPFSTFLINSCLVTGLAVLGDVITSSLVAFGFARLKSRKSGFLFMMVLATMMIPYQVIIIPQFILFKFFGWVDSLKPLFVPAFFGWPFFIFLLRQFFMTIPGELDDAARIDGCSTWRIYWNIMLPLCKPALATVAIFSFIANWNNFMAPLIYISSQAKYTLPLGLNLFRGRIGGTQYHLVMAVSVLTLLPIIVMFSFAQKYFIRGITLTGIKG